MIKKYHKVPFKKLKFSGERLMIFKRGYIGIYHYMSKKHLHRYCTEFGYRYNTRKQASVERFEDALRQVSSTRLTYEKLIGK